MPHYFHFDVFDKSEIHELEIINLNGWINNLTIEYGFGNFAATSNTLYWRIKGTAHTFTIPSKEFNLLSKGNYENHFKEVLDIFRKDIITWVNDGLTEEWMREYVFMFQKYISY